MSIQSATMVQSDSYHLGTVGQRQVAHDQGHAISEANISRPIVGNQTSHTSNEQTIAEKQILHSIDRVLKALQGPNTSLEMKIHEKTNQVIVKVMNRDTGEVIREIPPEKMQDLVAKMIEIAGLLVDERV